ncbi:ribosomal RNA small subunit methyltransferase G [Kordiimonas sediminis]|uniref:Ribosomal RNA small subunit methyltransferase G n=1 Tax=Kordiimonas sediminis TaxID=1735581 RepID=A0A919AP86_9PROT|nr:16S rRNA (guanine(527)-N(7))-methyltransferase RsmG [Kordiimonas sediminis]GHF15583.1 ribosomal RNA small subunit methyltransferase G [Kordiimonas sediminis]
MAVYSSDDLQRDLNVPRETMAHLETYAALLTKWQKAKNLVSNSTLPDMWRRHFLDSAQLVPFLTDRFSTDSKIVDIGSGAGFPGLVLAVMGVGHVHLVESNGKKCSFMNEVNRQTGAGAVIHNDRIEELDPFEADIISSRACARVKQLMDWARPFLKETTEFWLLKGESVDDELTEAQLFWNMQVETFDSLSEPSGVIVRLYQVSEKRN